MYIFNYYKNDQTNVTINGERQTRLCVPDSDGRVQGAAHHKHAVKLQQDKRTVRRWRRDDLSERDQSGFTCRE